VITPDAAGVECVIGGYLKLNVLRDKSVSKEWWATGDKKKIVCQVNHPVVIGGRGEIKVKVKIWSNVCALTESSEKGGKVTCKTSNKGIVNMSSGENGKK